MSFLYFCTNLDNPGGIELLYHLDSGQALGIYHGDTNGEGAEVIATQFENHTLFQRMISFHINHSSCRLGQINLTRLIFLSLCKLAVEKEDSTKSGENAPNELDEDYSKSSLVALAELYSSNRERMRLIDPCGN